MPACALFEKNSFLSSVPASLSIRQLVQTELPPMMPIPKLVQQSWSILLPIHCYYQVSNAKLLQYIYLAKEKEEDAAGAK
jgi:hypothetical protein